MKLLNMTQWASVCKDHSPTIIRKKILDVGYPLLVNIWQSSICDIYWQMIPADIGFRRDTMTSGKPVKQDGPMMMEMSFFEMIKKGG